MSEAFEALFALAFKIKIYDTDRRIFLESEDQKMKNYSCLCIFFRVELKLTLGRF